MSNITVNGLCSNLNIIKMIMSSFSKNIFVVLIWQNTILSVCDVNGFSFVDDKKYFFQAEGCRNSLRRSPARSTTEIVSAR